MIPYSVIAGFSVKTPEGVAVLKPGQVIKLPEQSARLLIEAGKIKPMPFITRWGTLTIPHNSPERYHWWSRGQSIKDTLRELGRCDLIEKYKSLYSDN